MARKVIILELDCYEVGRELVKTLEEDIKPKLRERIDGFRSGLGVSKPPAHHGLPNTRRCLTREQSAPIMIVLKTYT